MAVLKLSPDLGASFGNQNVFGSNALPWLNCFYSAAKTFGQAVPCGIIFNISIVDDV
jgi:hypothetical protein